MENKHFATRQQNSKTIGKYQLQEEVGRGGYSVVYKCKRSGREEFFAAKVIDSSRMSHKQKTRVDKEVEIHKKMKHENIVKLIDYVVDRTTMTYCIILEFVPFGELFDVIVAAGRFTEKQANIYVTQMLEALSFIHSKNIIHRDVKPENVLVVSKTECRIKLSDFGLAVEAADGYIEYGYAGTPVYMSPEMVRRLPYGKPTDIWSCGVVMYILLCGSVPFWGDDTAALEESIRLGAYPITTNEWNGISIEAKDLVSQMLITMPHYRITAHDALEHHWIKDIENIKDKELLTVIENLKSFNAKRKFKAGILTTFVLTLRSDSSSSASTATVNSETA